MRRTAAADAMSCNRHITADEVMAWSGTKSWSKAVCCNIADRLNGMMWPGDPDPPDIGEETEEAPKDWWDFKAAYQAAVVLRDNLPKMLAFFERARKGSGYREIQSLNSALSAAILHIEFPFGYGQALIPLSRQVQGMDFQKAQAYLRELGINDELATRLLNDAPEQLDTKLVEEARTQRRKKRHNVEWHIPAFCIAQHIGDAQGQSVSFSRKSICVRVVRKALIRMGYPVVTETAVAQYLNRHTVNTENGLRLRS